jgi:hypothetical protein
MKQVTFITALIAVIFQLNAQNGVTLTEGKPVLVYALPKTELKIEISIETIKQKPGIFYQYSERYLATNNVITEEKSTSKLKTIQLVSNAIADPNRTFTIIPSKSSALNNISVNEQGIITGINVLLPEATKKVIEKKVIKEYLQKDLSINNLLPLGEEFMMAGSSAKLAEGAAKQIYRIRESRLSLLTGDIEHLPSDGKSLESMLKGMDKMEQQLTELFIGKTIVETQTRIISIFPDSVLNNKILFRLSAFNGIVDADDLSGRPYYINIEPAKIKLQKPGEKEKSEKSGLYTILPASTKITITDGINIVYSGVFDIPQLGEIIPFSTELLSNPKIKIQIDPITGRLLGIN